MLTEQELATFAMSAGFAAGFTVALAVWLIRVVENLWDMLMSRLEHRRAATRRRAKLDATREAQPAL